MAEYTETLDRIADAIEQFSREAAQSGLNPWLTLILGALAGAALGVLGRYVVWDLQQKRLNRKKRALFAGLLGDEIDLRWRQKIGKDLKELFGDDYEIEHARRFCKKMKISQSDFPIFRTVYYNLLELDVFIGSYFSSHIVYVYILIKDLINAQDYLSVLLQKYDKETDDELRQKIDGEIEHNWKIIRTTIIDEIFHHTEIIFNEIQNDYRTTLDERRSRVENEVTTNLSSDP